MVFYSVILVAITACILGKATHGETLSKLKALQSLVFNNAQATVTLDSTALKQLVKLASNGKSQPQTKGVSFSVYVKAKDLELGDGQTLIYNGVLTNDGNGYDDRTGVFTCPLAGTYIFVVDSLSRKPAWFQLYHNKTAVASLHISGYHPSNTYLQISRTVILRLRKGDHVKVVNVNTKSGTAHRDSYSGFSGARLY
ncbi:complement C1q-like protein 3 [Crassostrea angulata]|uniref:complement C1q-like protein 3 n=1 Tax=Magallana angulata TaxID=2784310 RepID=UPI0022B13139|nr:complement C1q-like protein 3 [Crassostrea angulata]